jgi:hypothetical protein
MPRTLPGTSQHPRRVIEGGYTLEAAKRSVGPGWSGALDRLWAALSPQVRVVQVKAKFGALCVHLEDPGPGDINAVDAAMADSMATCECCGAPGTIQGWRTRCDAHRDESSGRDERGSA